MPSLRKFSSNADRQRAYRQRQQLSRQQEFERKGLPCSPSIPTMPGSPRWNAALQQVLSTLQMVRDEMEGYFDERSETWQEGERGQALQERVDALEGLIEDLRMLADM